MTLPFAAGRIWPSIKSSMEKEAWLTTSQRIDATKSIHFNANPPKSPDPLRIRAFLKVVAGRGFEPLTFRL